jgi:Putative DNA-binding domain
VGNIQQSVTRFDPKAPMRISVRARSDRQRKHGVKSHSSRKSLIEVLAARYPVIRRLVGELSFRIVARRFILSEPPSIAISPSYGDNFPRFLRGQGNAASFEYVADIAELEMVRGKARRAPDVRPLAEALLPLRAQWLNGLHITLHPSVCLVQSRFPIVTIWQNNQSGNENGIIDRWSAEAALVARPVLGEVEVRRLPPGGYTFVRALSEGQTVTIAVRAATAATSKFDVASNLALLIDANVIVGIHEAA